MILEVALIVAGLVGLYAGSRWLVDGASNLAASMGISSFVIGLTVVGFGTSSPETIFSIIASAQGAAEVSLGDIMGSNIANIGLILGLSAVIAPLLMSFKLLKNELLLMLGSMTLLTILGIKGQFGLLDGIILLSVFAFFTVYSLVSALKERVPAVVESEFSTEVPLADPRQKRRYAIIVLVGLAALLIGAQAVVAGAIGLATEFGIDEMVIGLTIVAIGTSVPELSVSIAASIKKKTDILISNIIGSNIFNSLFVLGIGRLLCNIEVAVEPFLITSSFMLALGIILTISLFRKSRISRPIGLLFLAIYGIYLAYLLTQVIGI